MNVNNLSGCLVPTNLKWFTFSQNNSGGSFTVNDKVDTYVIIQAPDADTANQLAENIGIYFNGVSEGLDCECCGDRWRSQWSDEGKAEPEIYGRKVPYSTDSVLTSELPDKGWGLKRGVKVYPYSVISKM